MSACLDPGFGHWLAGFIDGEGCFLIAEQKNYGQSVHYAAHFRISLRADDASILHEIAERTGIGRVSREVRTNGNPKVTWEVSRKAECLALVEMLDCFPLRAKKRRDFEIWREAVLVWAGMRGRGGAPGVRGQVPQDWTLLQVLRGRLAEARMYA